MSNARYSKKPGRRRLRSGHKKKKIAIGHFETLFTRSHAAADAVPLDRAPARPPARRSVRRSVRRRRPDRPSVAGSPLRKVAGAETDGELASPNRAIHRVGGGPIDASADAGRTDGRSEER